MEQNINFGGFRMFQNILQRFLGNSEYDQPLLRCQCFLNIARSECTLNIRKCLDPGKLRLNGLLQPFLPDQAGIKAVAQEPQVFDRLFEQLQNIFQFPGHIGLWSRVLQIRQLNAP